MTAIVLRLPPWHRTTHRRSRFGQTSTNSPAPAAPADLRKALYAYNHSWDYVDRVLDQAARYRQPAASPEQQNGADMLTPRTRRLHDLIKQQFGVPYGIGCYRPVEDGGEHPRGRACDFMLSKGGAMPSPSQLARGDAIAAWAQANADSLGALYVIWKQKIWNSGMAGQGWRPMARREGGHTGNHWDHVHVSMR
ncbi:hypothetical protein [Nonomuraea endophytica]|uniref:hypothetical protein n=1 Tax=Nonomuraea endophytica TaxID=714136 RepID=UPI0037C65C29